MIDAVHMYYKIDINIDMVLHNQQRVAPMQQYVIIKMYNEQ